MASSVKPIRGKTHCLQTYIVSDNYKLGCSKDNNNLTHTLDLFRFYFFVFLNSLLHFNRSSDLEIEDFARYFL